MYNRSMVGVTYYSAGACSTHGNTQCPCHNCTYNTGNATTDCPDDPHSRKITVFHCISWSQNPFPFGRCERPPFSFPSFKHKDPMKNDLICEERLGRDTRTIAEKKENC